MLSRYGEADMERLCVRVGEAKDSSSWLAMGTGASIAKVGKPSIDEALEWRSLWGCQLGEGGRETWNSVRTVIPGKLLFSAYARVSCTFYWRSNIPCGY